MDLLDKIQGNNFYLIDFYANWCAPCQLQLQFLENLKEKFSDNVEIIKIDVAKHNVDELYLNAKGNLVIYKGDAKKFTQQEIDSMQTGSYEQIEVVE